MTVKHIAVENLVVAPCQDACPAGIDVPRYIRAVRDKKYDEAVAVVREKYRFRWFARMPVLHPAKRYVPIANWVIPSPFERLKERRLTEAVTPGKNTRKSPTKQAKRLPLWEPARPV